MKRTSALTVLCVVVLAAQLGHAQTARTTWMEYGGGPDNARHMTLDQINKSNLDQLTAAWTYPTNDNVSYVFGPLVVDNTVYVLARNNSLVALDATTGQEIWIHEGLTGIAPRGINYWESKDRSDRRLLFQMNSYLQAIDARTGKSITTFGTDGAVNLREGLGRDPATIVKTQSSNPGKVFENLIILGSAAGENYVAPPGDLRAYDVVTGKLVWQFHTIPHPGEFGYETWPPDAWKYIGGVNTWGEITVDPVRGIAYFPLGSPTYDFYGADRHGANLFGSSLLALDARTGKRLWHFQMVHHDLWDYDNVSAPQLTTVQRDGKTIDVVAQAGKTGFLYVFDRVTGQPLWPIEERRVPASDIPGEAAWPTQPFPTNPPPFAPQRLTANDINPYILTAEERETWKNRIANARNEGLFTPPSLRDTVSIPGAQGGANWGCTAADPAKGIVYVLSINVPSIYKLSTEAPGPGGGGRAGGPAAIAQGRTLYEQKCESCHAANLAGSGNYPSLVDITQRMGPETLRETIVGGRPGMPPFNDMSQTELDALDRVSRKPERRERRPRRRSRYAADADRRSGCRVGRRVWRESRPAGTRRRNGWSSLPARSQGARSADVYGLRDERQYREAAIFNADGVRSEYRHDQMAGAGGRRRRARDRGGRQRHRLYQSSHRHRHHLNGPPVPGGRRWQAARLRFRERPSALDRPDACGVARHSGNV